MRPNQPASSAKVWVGLGSVAVTVVGAVLILKNLEAPAEHVREGESAPAAAISKSPIDHPSTSSEPSAVEADELADDDSNPAVAPPSIDREFAARTDAADAADADSDPSARISMAELIRNREKETLDRIEKAEAEQAAQKPAVAPDGEDRYFTLQLSGSVGGLSLDANDQQTWARLSYFLREEAAKRFYLVYPDGSIPHSMPTGSGAKVNPRKNKVDDSEPAGDSSQPAYRLVLDATTQAGGGIFFFGKQLGSSFSCRMTCRVEKRNGKDFTLVEQTSVVETSTPAKGRGQDVDSATYERRMHDATLDKLVLKLQGLKVFRN